MLLILRMIYEDGITGTEIIRLRSKLPGWYDYFVSVVLCNTYFVRITKYVSWKLVIELELKQNDSLSFY